MFFSITQTIITYNAVYLDD